MLRSDNPVKNYRSLHISVRWVGVLNPHASFVISMFSHQTRIVLKTLTFKLQSLIMNRYFWNTFRSDHSLKSVDSLYILHRGWFGILSPHFILYLNVFFLDANCSIEPYLQTGSHAQTFCVDLKWLEQNTWPHPKVLWKCAISDSIGGFMGNIYINITCSSSLWFQTYEIY